MNDEVENIEKVVTGNEEAEKEEVGKEEAEKEEAEEQISLEPASLKAKVEAIIFAAVKPMKTLEIYELLQVEEGITLEQVQDALTELQATYGDPARGFHLRYLKRLGFQFQTTHIVKNIMERQFASRPRPLSRAALETLAVIAYRQKKSKGVTRAEVEFIRGVEAGSMFKTLVDRGLISCIGKKEIPGRPLIFATTDEFLKTFQISHIDDLPSLDSFQIPQDVLKAANEKIEIFENEQGLTVDVEEFIGDDDSEIIELAPVQTESNEVVHSNAPMEPAVQAQLDL